MLETHGTQTEIRKHCKITGPITRNRIMIFFFFNIYIIYI